MATKSETDFQKFQNRLENEVLSHRIIQDNHYCKWFEAGSLIREDVREFAIQFSVFSNQFLLAQTNKMINAVDLNQMRSSKEILANEIGCMFRPIKEESAEDRSRRAANAENEGDPKYVNTEGTVDGSRFFFKAAHFEWLLKFCRPLGLEFSQVGKRRHGWDSTLFFCDELIRIYGSEDFSESAGASFAVENWAAAGFWKQLIAGLRAFRSSHDVKLPLAFFTWHDKVEDQHRDHTYEELKELYFGEHPFDEDRFILAGAEMLNGVAAFWDGLNDDRIRRRNAA